MQYLARDMNGDLYLHSEKPTMIIGMWDSKMYVYIYEESDEYSHIKAGSFISVDN